VAASRVREGGRTFPDSHTDSPPGSIVAVSRPPPLGATLILLQVHGTGSMRKGRALGVDSDRRPTRRRLAQRRTRADGDAVADGEAVGEAVGEEVGAVVAGTGRSTVVVGCVRSIRAGGS
jgi:hypothetical protein